MINTALQLKIILAIYWNNIVIFLGSFLENLDPSLFQNIILGMLSLLVPVGVGVLSFFFQERSKGNIASNLELFILLKTILKADKIVIFSFVGLFLLSLYNVNMLYKILGVLFFGFYIIWILLIPFKNIWKWFLKDTKDFSISFLRGLNIRKNKNTILNSWQALWLNDKQSENERYFTDIFISHIDDSIKHKDFYFAIQLSQIYVTNIEKRDHFSVGSEILPKVFEWSEIFWNKEQLWLKEYDTSKKIQSLISQKHFPAFRNWVIKISNRINLKRDRFWNWHYFGGEFFQSVIKILLKDGHGPYQLFTSFKKHIDESLKKLEEIENKEEKDKYDHYITGLFASFCPTFFNEINSSPSNYNIWENDFPKEWKISTTNTKNEIPGVILHEFIQWSRDRIFKKDSEENYDKDLSDVINGIFPNVHSSLFTSFLRLFFSSEIKYALEKEANFYILGVSVSWSGSIEESDEDRDIRLAEMMREEEISQKNETLQIIFRYFHFWQTLMIYKDNLSEDEFKDWNSYTELERQLIVKRVRKEKLEKIKEELDSKEIKNICDGFEKKEQIRKNLLELINLLIEEIQK
ncbi:MAG: hypothetical protein PHS54_05445 [Clostridia bacterium]|nr:hypothetical protein [Clostridia bacterium]